MIYLLRSISINFKFLLLFFATVQIVGCNSVDSDSEPFEQENSNSEWLLQEQELFDGGPGKDGIPSVDNPKFTNAKGIEFIDDSRLIVGIRVGDEIKAYPHQIMDYHEIVNDFSDGVPFCMTYCPLTGTALAWERNIKDEVAEFGVSGLIYRNNLIPYDRKTNSYYSQMQVRGVHGEQKGEKLKFLQIIETTWATWKSMYPESEVLTTNTGFERDYSGFAYGANYADLNSGTLFPVKNKDERLPNKKRVFGVVQVETVDQESRVIVYPIDEFDSGINLIQSSAHGDPIVIGGSRKLNFGVSFFRKLKDGTVLNFQPIQNSLPVIMKDQEGNRWDIFGYAVEGPRKGLRLDAPLSYSGYWFAWADFFPRVEIYGDDSIPNP